MPHGAASRPNRPAGAELSARAAAARGRRRGCPSESTSVAAPPVEVARGACGRPGRSAGRCRCRCRAAGLDHAVGVEHQRVAASAACPAARRKSASGDQPEHRALGLERRPAAGAGAPVDAPAGGRPSGPRRRRCEVEARGGRRSRSPPPSPGEQVVVGRRAGTRRAGSAPSRPPKAPESSSARVPARSPLPETSTTATSSRPVVGVADDEEVARERRAAGRAEHRLGVPRPGQRGQHALALDPVAQVDQHRLAHAARRRRAGTGGTRSA